MIAGRAPLQWRTGAQRRIIKGRMGESDVEEHDTTLRRPFGPVRHWSGALPASTALSSNAD